MLTRNKTGNTSEEELQIRSKDNNNIIYIAIVIVILATLVAMTGVYYEYW